MYRIIILSGLLILGLQSYSQNDVDAIRYSRYGVNGTSRFMGLGGAFGALGADLSCAAYNPAGLALYRKGEITFSGGLRTTNNEGIINSKSSNVSNAGFVFNNFGILGGWEAKNDKESRNIISFTNSQTQNFLSKTRMSSYTNNSSIVKDMLNIANTSGTTLNSFYEDLGYQTYLMDYDTINKKYTSLVDTKRSVKQTRDIVTSGKVNELNFSYAYAYKDEFYFGVSLGLPRLEYTSTTTHSEADDKDSMRINYTNSNTYTSTYLEEPSNLHYNPYYQLRGFNSLTYTEYFKTKGSGVNLKIGGIARLNDNVRLGLYYHTPTIYTLKDEYYNSMTAVFDGDIANPKNWKDPKEGGYFNYKIITPSRISANAAIIVGKLAAIGIDYEIVNYKNASLSSGEIADFAGVNSVIKNKYTPGHNVRIGTEFNIKPVMLRVGYNMQGSPFGDVFTGSFVRNSFSVGAGFRTRNNLYFDFVWVKTVSNEDYYFFNTLPQKATIKYNATNVSATVGIKF
ncbi:MAG: hypothetical protein H0W73_20525 [Bacteroidetes bacterium]|nr:hypothetical protein [Bacteroidota bacterium]